MTDEEYDTRISDLEAKVKSIESIVFHENGIIPQSIEMKKVVKSIQEQLVMISTSVDQIYNYRAQFIDAMDKLDSHDNILTELRTSMQDMAKTKDECSLRVKDSLDRMLITLYGNGNPDKGIAAKMMEMASSQKILTKIGIIIIILLIGMLGWKEYLNIIK